MEKGMRDEVDLVTPPFTNRDCIYCKKFDSTFQALFWKFKVGGKNRSLGTRVLAFPT